MTSNHMTYKSIDSMGGFRLLDLYCGGGGAAVGYHRAGFEVVGVDIVNQPHYPFEFHQADALEYLVEHGHEYDAIHASPPCQKFSRMQNITKSQDRHPDLINPTRQLLIKSGKPYIIENVIGAPVRIDVMLCGTMFGLPIIRHRGFECSFQISPMVATCNHQGVYNPWMGVGRTAVKFREAMGIDWLPHVGGRHKSGSLDEAIPPAYTLYIGRQLITMLNNT